MFSSLRVLELSSVLAGPAVGMFFAELGAHVIKVENKRTGGDVTRQWKHPNESIEDPKSAYYHSVNWNKEALQLDIQHPDDYTILIQLIRGADILISNFKADSAIRLKVDYETVKKENPKLIYASISAYGTKDNRSGFDALLQAETGWMSMNGQPESPPTKMPVALIDILAAHQLKEGILTALLKRTESGKGSQVTVSLFDAAISALANQASNYLNLGIVPTRKGSQHPNIAPYGDSFITNDNKEVLLAIGTDQQFEDLCKIINVPDAALDPRFKTNASRVKHRQELKEVLSKCFSAIDSIILLEKAKQENTPLSLIQDLDQLFQNPSAQELVLSQKEEDGFLSKRVKTVVFKITP